MISWFLDTEEAIFVPWQGIAIGGINHHYGSGFNDIFHLCPVVVVVVVIGFLLKCGISYFSPKKWRDPNWNVSIENLLNKNIIPGWRLMARWQVGTYQIIIFLTSQLPFLANGENSDKFSNFMTINIFHIQNNVIIIRRKGNDLIRWTKVR